MQQAKDAKTAYNGAIREYAACVLRPDLYTAKIPSLFPIPTHLCQTKGVQYLTTNATGNICIGLLPHRVANTLVYNNSASYTETSTWLAGSWSEAVPAAINTYSTQFRVVAAWMKVEYLEPALTRKGVITCGFMPYSPFAGGVAFTNDALRDQPGVQAYNASTTPKAWGRYVPIDPSSLVFYSGTLTGTQPTIAWCLTGGAANSSVAVAYRIVYEIVPAPQYTDLLVPTKGPQGDPNDAVVKLASAPTSGTGDLSSGGSFAMKFKEGAKGLREHMEEYAYSAAADKLRAYADTIVRPQRSQR